MCDDFRLRLETNLNTDKFILGLVYIGHYIFDFLKYGSFYLNIRLHPGLNS